MQDHNPTSLNSGPILNAQIKSLSQEGLADTDKKCQSQHIFLPQIPETHQQIEIGRNEAHSQLSWNNDNKIHDNTKQKPQKTHGFACPMHPQQILTYFIFLYNIAIFYAVLIPAICGVSIERIAIAATFGSINVIFLILVIKYSYETTIIDPTDQTVYQEREAQIKGYDAVSFDIEKYDYYCNVCKTHVLENTKHCQACNRCVQNFDHHCPWLNNCIGSRNYSQFIKMLVWATIAVILHETAGFVALYFEEHFTSIEKSPQQSVYILIVSSMALNGPILIFLIKLLVFHIYLMTQQITTYQFILLQRERETKQKQKSKVILQKNEHKQQHIEIDLEKDDLAKLNQHGQKSTELENNSNFPSHKVVTDTNEDKIGKISCFKMLMNKYQQPQQQRRPSIKVKPINENSFSKQLQEEIISNDDLDNKKNKDELIKESRGQHETLTLNRGTTSQLKLEQQFEDHHSGRSEHGELVQNMNFQNEESCVRQRTLRDFDEPDIRPSAFSKRTSVNRKNNASENCTPPIQSSIVTDGGKKMNVKINANIVVHEESSQNPSRASSKISKSRTPFQERTPQLAKGSIAYQKNSRQLNHTIQDHETSDHKDESLKEALAHHLQSQPHLQNLDIENMDDRLKTSMVVQSQQQIIHTTIIHQHSVDFSVKEYEESVKGRTSRNDRGQSDMNSVASKKKIYEHKILL